MHRRARWRMEPLFFKAKSGSRGDSPAGQEHRHRGLGSLTARGGAKNFDAAATSATEPEERRREKKKKRDTEEKKGRPARRATSLGLLLLPIAGPSLAGTPPSGRRTEIWLSGSTKHTELSRMRDGSHGGPLPIFWELQSESLSRQVPARRWQLQRLIGDASARQRGQRPTKTQAGMVFCTACVHRPNRHAAARLGCRGPVSAIPGHR